MQKALRAGNPVHPHQSPPDQQHRISLKETPSPANPALFICKRMATANGVIATMIDSQDG